MPAPQDDPTYDPLYTVVQGSTVPYYQDYDPEQYRQYLLSLYYAQLAQPANWVEDISQPPSPYGEGGGGGEEIPPTPYDPEEEVVVTGERVDEEELTNEELEELGTDTAYEILDRRYGTGGYVAPFAGGFQDTAYDEAFYMAPITYAPELLSTFLMPVIAPFAGLFALFAPTPAGPPDEYDLQLNPIRPPPRPPREVSVPDYFVDPPDWRDLIRDPFDPGIDFTPGVRLFPFPVDDEVRAKPISDLPDLFTGVIPELEIPIFSPIEVPDYDPIAEPAPDTRPGRRPAPVGSPGDLSNPFDDPLRFAFPYGMPGIDPVSPTAPEVFPEPRTPTEPIARPGDPIGGVIPIGGPFEGTPAPGLEPFPLTAFAPEFAAPDVDTCDCEGGGKKKKKKKKKPREVCYRGTYIERSRSLTKQRKEEIPCQ